MWIICVLCRVRAFTCEWRCRVAAREARRYRLEAETALSSALECASRDYSATSLEAEGYGAVEVQRELAPAGCRRAKQPTHPQLPTTERRCCSESRMFLVAEGKPIDSKETPIAVEGSMELRPATGEEAVLAKSCSKTHVASSLSGPERDLSQTLIQLEVAP